MDKQRALGEIAVDDHILDAGEQERRAGVEQALVRVGVKLAAAFSAAFVDDAERVRQPFGKCSKIVEATTTVVGGDENVAWARAA